MTFGRLRAIPTFYDEAMLADFDSFSPAPWKARVVLPAWQAQQLPVDVMSFLPVTPDDLALAHNPAFVAGVLAGQIPNKVARVIPNVDRVALRRHAKLLVADDWVAPCGRAFLVGQSEKVTSRRTAGASRAADEQNTRG